MSDPAQNEFRSWRSYQRFARSVLRDLRYVRSQETEAFLATVLATSSDRRVDLSPGRIFWRAQLGHDWRPINDTCDEEIPCAYSRARMKPLPDRASDGRANPRGIPCLYVANSKVTAMSEVRPWIGSYISVGQFETTRDLKLIDCARHHEGFHIYLDEPDAAARAEAVWTDIDRAFAEPMTRSDDIADYAATQILAELFKSAGADGLVYRSNFGENGFNIALFDLDAAELINCGLFKVDKIEPTFSEADNFYYVRRDPPDP